MNLIQRNRKEILDELKNLNERELCEIFYEVFDRFRETYNEGGSTEFINTAYVISESSARQEANIVPIALPNRQSSGHISDETCQNGYCERCKLECYGFSKSSICPVCKSKIRMT